MATGTCDIDSTPCGYRPPLGLPRGVTVGCGRKDWADQNCRHKKALAPVSSGWVWFPGARLQGQRLPALLRLRYRLHHFEKLLPNLRVGDRVIPTYQLDRF